MKDALRSFMRSRSIIRTMYYAYIIRSETHPLQLYYGSTTDIKNRLHQHNNGQSAYTKKYKPWRVVWYCSFESKQKAQDFEKYLKSASGKAFMRKRLI